ncbi:hypothetical protein JAAARDRAFT_124786 [Jaapia argillacea MUCL 33604]|uniref:Extradiol ring-cleavage dioxygenase class III enzyme subunit B domain-containing protein n=1 Tax=Jaapia argillacea MUCL 33604 TaxID=933084 RepID=A0A067QAT7_9AGAM|nr:hypothetical protein JAAARDRAFT_124786 [Jaapia argillacea MUCL 33604]
MATNSSAAVLPRTQQEWRAALASLPASPKKIPAFFFGHGSPMLAFPPTASSPFDSILSHMGPNGSLANFLRDFGPALLEKYNPKAIVVFSAHWETSGERVVTDYGESNPLLMDYFGFQKELYELEFKSRGDGVLSRRIVELYKEAGQLARTTPITQSRGQDGRGFQGPGLDHGVFVPFRLMFSPTFTTIPIIQVSIDASLSPQANWKVGQVVNKLREEGVLVLSGGLTIHNLRDFSSFSPDGAGKAYKEFDKAVLDALSVDDAEERRKALLALPQHPSFHLAHPRAEHFVPIYVAAGAGDDGEGTKAKILSAVYGCTTVAFGV